MQQLNFSHITAQPVFEKLCNEKSIEVSALRLDRIHPVISGNKWFKLRNYLDEAVNLNKKTIITFGGAWSNHIIATAAACHIKGLNAIGIIRGEEPAVYSETLKAALQYGMKFCFISRKDFRNKKIPADISREDSCIIAEGGYGQKGAEGFSTALNYCHKNYFTHFICAVGTGTMMAGLIKSALPEQTILGIPVLKNNPDLLRGIKQLLTTEESEKNFGFIEGYHFGGYAKYTAPLIGFMNSFFTESGVPTDFVYTGKLFYATEQLLRENYFAPESKILVLHSGGLQGNTSLPAGTLIF
jgi:1-aminocyclopropane-1-carboxylate deaminase